MAAKTFDTAGYSTYKGERKFRVANGLDARRKVLERNGHTDIELQALPHAMTKQEAEQFFGIEPAAKPAKKPAARAAKPAAKPKQNTVKAAAKAAKPAKPADEFKRKRLEMIRNAAEKLTPNEDSVAPVPDADAMDYADSAEHDLYDVLGIA